MPPLPPPITSRTNARVKALRQAFSGRAAQPGELAGIEGMHLLAEARVSNLWLETVFLRQGAEESLPMEMLAGWDAAEMLVLSREVFDSVVDTATPQPLAATVRIPAGAMGTLRAGSGAVLVLEDIQDPGNLGTLIRSAEAFGVREVFLTPGCANAWGPKGIRASAGSVFRVPVQRMALGEIVGLLRGAGVPLVAAVARSAEAVASPEARLGQPLAVMIGNEGAGLSPEAQGAADLRVHIPCAIESLNAAIAGSLLLYEAQRQRLAGTHEGAEGTA